MMLLPPPSTHTRILNVFPANAFECASPLKSLVHLIEMMGQWVDMAMSGGTCKYSPHHRPYTETGVASNEIFSAATIKNQTVWSLHGHFKAF